MRGYGDRRGMPRELSTPCRERRAADREQGRIGPADLVAEIAVLAEDPRPRPRHRAIAVRARDEEPPKGRLGPLRVRVERCAAHDRPSAFPGGKLRPKPGPYPGPLVRGKGERRAALDAGPGVNVIA